MTESDQAGQGGQARRGDGRTTATETVDKPDAAQGAKRGASSAGTPQTSDRTSGGKSSSRGAAKKAQRSAQKSTSTTSSSSATSSSGSARNGSASRGSQPSAARTAARKPRRARLRLTQVDAWTVMKTAFLLSIALGIVSVVAVAVVWTVLGVAGVFDSMNDTIQTLLGNDFRVQDYIGTGRILGFTMILAVVNVVLLTAIATLAAFLYNLSATLLGGVEVTLTEDA